jgi:hypothetical protein
MIGAFGVVSLVEEKETGTLYAMKEVRRGDCQLPHLANLAAQLPTASKERVRTFVDCGMQTF